MPKITLPDMAEDFYRNYARSLRSTNHRWLACLIEEGLPKPKPEEPKNAGAVIRHMGHYLWVLDERGKWVSLDEPQTVDWEDFGEVEVLFEGVPE